MKKLFRITLGLLLIVVILGLIGSGFLLFRFGEIYSGYIAQQTCSGLYVSQRGLEKILEEDLSDPFGLMAYTSIEIKSETRRVTASIVGRENTAVYRDGLGCTLLNDGITLEDLLAQPYQGLRPEMKRDSFWEERTSINKSDGMEAAMNFAFAEPDPDRPLRTRAVVVVHNGRIVAERYSFGTSPDTRHIGWSMTKSVMNALVGTLVQSRKLGLEDPLPVPEWQADPSDPRSEITLDNLLRQSSGLKFDEGYFLPWSDVNQMLWLKADTGAYAANQPLEHRVNSHWHYSSGTTNIISRALKSVIGSQKRYFEYPRKALFEPLGMSSALIEADASGTFIGSSLMYASARDWARFGLLYLQNGVWEGTRILPEDWVKYTTLPTIWSPQRVYGSHFWLNAGNYENLADRRFPKLPTDLYFASGFQGQYIVIDPSQRLVIVRLGMSNYDPWPVEEFVSLVRNALRRPKN